MGSVISSLRGSASSQRGTLGITKTSATRRARVSLPTKPWLQFALAFGALTLLLILSRGNELWASGVQNQDEAELIAEGRSAAADLLPYGTYTTSTHLFLWPFFLGLLDRLDIPLTLVTAHVISGLSYVMLATTGWFLLMRQIGGVRAAFLVLPTAMFLFVGAGHADFLSMASESLPLVILCISALILLGPRHAMSTRQLVAGSLVAGLAVWAKPQSGPIAVALLISSILLAFVERERSNPHPSARSAFRVTARSAVVAALALVAPTLLFLGVMLAAGTLDDFRREPIAVMWDYTANRDVTQGIVAPGLRDRLAGVASFSISNPLAAGWALGGLLSLRSLDQLHSIVLRALWLIAVLLPATAAVSSLLPVHPLFPHYANFLYLGCLLASCVGIRLARPYDPVTSHGQRWVDGTFFGVTIIMVGVLALAAVPGRLADLAAQGRRAVTGGGVSFGNEIPLDRSALAQSCPAGSRALMWGWAPELYSYYDWMPASRYVNSTWLINNSRRQRLYGSILLRELKANPPDCIVEALGSDFMGSIDPSVTLRSTVPGAGMLLASCYRESESRTFDRNPVTLYTLAEPCTSAE